MEEVYEREKRTKAVEEGANYDVGNVEWYQDIWPLLQRAPLLSWVNGQANGGHGGGSDLCIQVLFMLTRILQDQTDREISSTKDGKLRYPIPILITSKTRQFGGALLVE